MLLVRSCTPIMNPMRIKKARTRQLIVTTTVRGDGFRIDVGLEIKFRGGRSAINRVAIASGSELIDDCSGNDVINSRILSIAASVDI